MIGRRLTELREERKLTQTAVANDLNMTPSSYGLYEREKRSPDYKILKKMADYYGVSMAYLLGETDDRCPLVSRTQFNENPEELYFYKETGFNELDDEGQKMARDYIEYLKLKHAKK